MKYVRASIKFVAFVTATLLLYSVWFVFRLFIPNKVFWRQWAFESWTKCFVWISGMKIEVIGDVPKPPFFLVTNHTGYVDVATLRAVVKGVFVAKNEVQSWFLAGRIVRDMGNIFIDRGNRRDIPRAGNVIIERLNGGEGVIVFPEGTSTRGDDILPFNSSFFEFAAKTGLAVSYASIGYRSPDGEEPASKMVCWWDESTFMQHLFRLFQLKEFTAIINFGDGPVANQNRKVLASDLYEKVKQKFVPIV
jgi:1-acyl-sn-glycerol-3-phosphate acyltransferase